MLQQTFKGQEFNLTQVSLLPEDGFLVPGICGPQAASEMDKGNESVPVLKQMDVPRQSNLHPFQPHVLWLNVSTFSAVIP